MLLKQLCIQGVNSERFYAFSIGSMLLSQTSHISYTLVNIFAYFYLTIYVYTVLYVSKYMHT